MIDLSKLITAEDKASEAERNRKIRINREAQEFLDNTDWYITRELETGVPIPKGMGEARQDARDRIVKVEGWDD